MFHRKGRKGFYKKVFENINIIGQIEADSSNFFNKPSRPLCPLRLIFLSRTDVILCSIVEIYVKYPPNVQILNLSPIQFFTNQIEFAADLSHYRSIFVGAAREIRNRIFDRTVRNVF